MALVELAAVVAMVAILVALALVVGEDSRRNGRLTECASNLKRVGVGMGVFAKVLSIFLKRSDDYYGDDPGGEA